MNFCRTCKHWEDYQHPDHPFGQCKHPLLNGDRIPDLNGLAEMDTNGYDPAIATGPDFGCIHHDRHGMPAREEVA